MASRFTEVIMDCRDLETMTTFWSQALGYQEIGSGDGWVAIGPGGDQPTAEALRHRAQPPNLAFVAVPEHKTVKNRLHLDLTPIDRSQADEVDRLVALGARTIDIGQRDVPWVVMADPENNEFCVMASPD